MKKIIVLPLAIIMLTAVMAFSPTYVARIFYTPIVKLEPKPIVLTSIPLSIPVPLPMKIKAHNEFLDAIGHRESGNRYDIVNTYGYMGKYQFGKATLKGLGIKVSSQEFLNSPMLQETAMRKLMLHNRKKLRRLIEKYEGQVVHGVIVTESGVLAAAHLAGQGNVKKWFRKGTQFRDGYGTRLTSYMILFGGYKLQLDI
tara:strand:+ start:130 stop:726 length:597 start_codon:yes stop_codon:yes gene_type:complete